MAMRKSFLWLFVFVGVAIIVVAWLALRYIPPEVPDNLAIPGVISYKETERNSQEILMEAKVSYLGTEYNARFALKLDAKGQIVLPGSDEVFTTVVAEEEGLELWRDTEKIGKLPIVFITGRNDAGIYRVGPPGTSLRPVSVRPGIQNLAVFHFDTEIQGIEGVSVTLFRDGRQFDAGKLPMITRLGGKQGIAKIDGVQVKGIGGTGVFSVFYSEHKLREGVNKILPTARFVGYTTWHDGGTFLGMSDVCYILQGDKVVILGQERAEAELTNVDLKGVEGDPITKDGRLVVKADGKYLIVSKDGKVSEIGFTTDLPVTVSGNMLVSGKRAFDLTNGKEFAFEEKYWWIADGVLLSQLGNELVGKTIASDGIQEKWRVKLAKPLKEDAKISKVKNDVFFFRMGKSCTEFINVLTGKCGKNIDILTFDSLETIEGEGLAFPNGFRIKQNIVCADENGKPLWARNGTKPERVGATSVLVWDDKAMANVIYDIVNGNEVISWKGSGLSVKRLNKSHLAATVNVNHLIFVQRLINY